jgi:hypothetical protein
MHPSNLIILLALLLSGIQSLSQPALPCSSSCQPVGQCGSIAVSGGLCPGSPTFFCEGDTVCVENNSDPASFDKWLVWWDDGTCDTFTNTVKTAYHVYHYPDSCLSFEAITPEILIKNVRFCGPGNTQFSRNCVETYVQIKVNPVAAFIKPQKLCVGQEACFIAAGCENADTAFYKWYIDGVFAGTALEACNTFTTKGWHTVRHIMTNECGADTITEQIWVRDIPEAVSAFVYSDSVGCIPAYISLDDQSLDYNSIIWKVIPTIGVTFAQSILVQPDTMLVISKADTFMVIHIAKNECGADTSSLEIITYDVPGLDIEPPTAGCGELSYAPEITWSGSIDTVRYFLNNNPPVCFSKQPSMAVAAWRHMELRHRQGQFAAYGSRAGTICPPRRTRSGQAPHAGCPHAFADFRV